MGNVYLAMLYATYIMRGKKTFEEVPDLIKPQVQRILEEEGVWPVP